MNSNRHFNSIAILFAAAFALAWGLGGSVGAHAEAVAGATAPVWFDPNNPMCRQGCTYDKAVEMLSIMALTAETELDMVQKSPESPEAQKAMEGFCTDDSDCFSRYERYQLLYLQNIKGEMARLESAHASLLSKRVGAPGSNLKTEGADIPAMAIEVRPDDAPKKPILPYFPSMKELKAQYEIDHAKNQASITEGFKDWLDHYPIRPSEEDFVKTKKILRDPAHPTAGTFTVVATQPNGKPEIDDKAYKFALESYEAKLKLMGGVGKDDQTVLKKYYSTSRLREVKNHYAKEFKPDDVSKKAFIESRLLFVHKTNEEIKKGGDKTALTPPANPAQTTGTKSGGGGAFGAGTRGISSTTSPSPSKTTSPPSYRSPSDTSSQSVDYSIAAVKDQKGPKGEPDGNEQPDAPPAGFKTDESLVLNAKRLGKDVIERINKDVRPTALPEIALPPMDTN